MARVWDRITGFARAVAGDKMPRGSEVIWDGTPGADATPGQQEIARNRDYFGVTINQLMLVKGREFWSTYDPLVYVAVDFVHGKDRICIPKLVGPSALRGSLVGAPGNLPHG